MNIRDLLLEGVDPNPGYPKGVHSHEQQTLTADSKGLTSGWK